MSAIIRSSEEIVAEIAALKAIKPRVPEFSKFGNNNGLAIEAQIAVLENSWDEDRIEEAELEPRDDEPWADEYAVENARDAAQWLFLESDESCSEAWSAIAR